MPFHVKHAILAHGEVLLYARRYCSLV